MECSYQEILNINDIYDADMNGSFFTYFSISMYFDFLQKFL